MDNKPYSFHIGASRRSNIHSHKFDALAHRLECGKCRVIILRTTAMKKCLITSLLGFSIAAVCLVVCSPNLFAQLSTFPAGRNQHSEVSQWMGLVKVTVHYSSPSVKNHASGKDRSGEVWGKLVPYGMNENPYRVGSTMPKRIPWRAGANENTTISFSHDVTIEGQKLAAGTYGLHMIPDTSEWTIIFSKNPKAWGSFFYDPVLDAMRVKVKPQATEFHADLSYEFSERELGSCTLALKWEKLRVPVKIAVPNIAELHLAQIRLELTSGKGFSWQDYLNGARFCLNTFKGNYEEALEWINRALECNTLWADLEAAPININVLTLQTKAALLVRLNRMSEADSVINVAITHPTSTAKAIARHGKFLMGEKKNEEALKVFQKNEAKFPKDWAAQWGLAQGFAAQGDLKKSLKYAQQALSTIGNEDEEDKKEIQAAINKLKANQNFVE